MFTSIRETLFAQQHRFHRAIIIQSQNVNKQIIRGPPVTAVNSQAQVGRQPVTAVGSQVEVAQPPVTAVGSQVQVDHPVTAVNSQVQMGHP